ncbi:hypothetical protein TL16_g00387 [Triparma laevis f. inornata]|uniref:PAP/OAS1 substrate-binding-related domain-containing protein n=1 Tax=Triparma laevis f. inornata TaxID=1714386 RepID=A0A9W6ZAT3_9STRA|nr:hypothetical protein TL16_g00387 [Triparma laevis f. inornata]
MSVIKSQIEHNFLGVAVLCVGSMACGTDVPGSDVDLTVIVPPDQVLEAGGERNFLTSILYFLTLMSTDEKSEQALAGTKIGSVEMLTKTNNPIIRIEINGTQADISVNKLAACASTAFLCNIFRRQNSSPLINERGFLGSCIKAIKSWAMQESAKYVDKPVIGSSNNMFSSYCYSIMVLALFSHETPTNLAEFFEEFFKYYAEFDWERQCLTVKGAVAHGMLQTGPGRRGDPDPAAASPVTNFDSHIDQELYLYKDFGMRVMEGSSWIHVKGANIQDPINFGNNISKSVSEGNLKTTLLAFKFGLQHLALIKKYGASTREEGDICSKKGAPTAPWELSKHFPFLWPSFLNEDPSRLAQDREPQTKYNEFKEFVNMQGSSPVNQTNEDIAPPPDAHMCPFSRKKITGKVKQEEHLQSRHWVTLSFLPTSSFHEILYRDKTFAKDAPHYSTADVCPMFLVDDGNFLDRQSSEDLELGPPQEEWGAGFVNGGLTMFMQKEGGSRMSRRRNRKRLDSNGNLDTSSSIGTIDSLDMEGLQVWDRMGSEVGDDYGTEQPDEHHYESNGAHTPQANGKQLLAAPSGDGLEYEDYTARRKSLGAKAKDEPKKAQPASRVPTNTSPAMSWADRANPYAERKAPTSAEITISGVIIRARLISQEFQEVVDPELKSREAERQTAKGNGNDGWFKDTKKRIMWVLNVNDHNYNIVLFHSTISGKKSISINGTCLAVKSKALVDFGGQFKFKLGWIKIIVSCESRLSGNFKYKLLMEGLKEPILVC